MRKLIVVLALVALAVTGCGKSTNKAKSSTTSSTTPALTVGVATDAKLGTILVDAQGMTLYKNIKDKQPGTLACTANCLQTWPALTVTAGVQPSGPAGLPGTLATFTRPEGAVQVTYNDQLLYRFASDTKPGDTNGQGVGNVWFVVTPADLTATSTTAASGTSGGTSGGVSPTARPATTRAPSPTTPATTRPTNTTVHVTTTRCAYPPSC